MDDSGFVLKVSLDFGEATRQLREWKRKNLDAALSAATKAGSKASPGVSTVPSEPQEFRRMGQQVRLSATLFGRLNASLNALVRNGGALSRTGIQSAARAASHGMERVAGNAGKVAHALMAFPGATQLAAMAMRPVSRMMSAGGEAIRLYNVQKRAETSARQILSNSGMGEDVFRGVRDRAGELQGRTIYGDEAMIAGAAELSTYVKDPELLKRMMGTLADYAAGMTGNAELDTKQMTDLATGLGKAMFGAYDSLRDKGFDTDELKALDERERKGGKVTDAERLAALERAIADYRGMAETFAATDEGRIIQAKNAVGDMKEEIGGELQPVVAMFTASLSQGLPKAKTAIMDAVRNAQPALERLSSRIAEIDWTGIVQAVSFVAEEAVGVAERLAYAFRMLSGNADALKASLSAVAAAVAGITALKFAGWLGNFRMAVLEAASATRLMSAEVLKFGAMKIALAGLGAATTWAVGKIAEAALAMWELAGEKGKERMRAQGYAEHGADYASLVARRREWKEAKEKAGDAYGKNPYATRSVDEAYARYAAAAEKVRDTDYGEGVAGGGISESMRRELGWKVQASRDGKAGVTNNSIVNCGNTAITNNISTDVKDLADIIRRTVDEVMTSHLTVRTGIERMKAVNL